MTVAETFLAGRNFLTPAFRIELDGRDAGREVISDVLEVSFTSDLDNIDSFEFVLHDWDPVGLRPKYSSPWDATGTPLRLSPGGPAVPDFRPGAVVTLYLGYVEDGELPLIMEGEVVSLAPNFPASGVPTCRVRALNKVLRGLQKTWVEGNYDGTPKAVVDQLCGEHRIAVQWDQPDTEGKAQDSTEVDGPLYDEIAKRVSEYDLSIAVLPPSPGNPDGGLRFFNVDQGREAPVAEFIWGRTLVSFTPSLSAAAQVSEVVVRGSDPSQPRDRQKFEARRTWSDIGLSATALGPAGTSGLDMAVGGVRRVVEGRDIHDADEALREADRQIRKLAATLITGAGVSIGLPALRAAARVTMTGLGARFDGVWRLTQATHTIAGAGYTTSFQARKEVLGGP